MRGDEESDVRSFQKIAGRFCVNISQGAPRWIEIIDKDNEGKMWGIQIEDARDLLYALDRIVKLSEEDDAEWRHHNP